MALPTSMVQNLRSRAQSGIVIGFKPSTGKRYRIELKRSTQSSTASTNWTSIFLDPTSRGFTYRDELPLSTRTYYYRARQLGVGSSNSSYSMTVNAKPQQFPEVWKPLSLGHNNRGNVEVLGGDVWLSSSKTAKVGTQQSTGLLSKTLRLSFNQVLPALNTETWDAQSGYLTPNALSVTRSYAGAVVLPKGVTIKSFASRFRRGGAGGSAVVYLKKSSSAAVVTDLAQNSATTVSPTNFQTITKTTLSELIGDLPTYYVYVQLFSTAAAGAR